MDDEVRRVQGSARPRRSRRAPRRPSSTRWSPAADRIAIADDRGILVVAARVHDDVRIVAPYASQLAWSPDGRHIAFAAPGGRLTPGRAPTELFVASAVGGAPVRLTHDAANLGGIAWTPQ